MTKPRRFLLLSIATLLAGIIGIQAASAAPNDASDNQAQAGIEREPDIPLPVSQFS